MPNHRNPAKGVRFAGAKGKCQGIVEIINSLLKPDMIYLEPFVGSGKIIQNVRNDSRRFGSDMDPFIIELLRAVQSGWEPPDKVSEGEYRFWMEKWRRGHYEDGPIEDDKEFALVAFIGYGCSFGARFFEGYARSKQGTVNFAASAKKALLRQKPLLKNVWLEIADYREVNLGLHRIKPLKPGIIYCDPPYESTKPVGNQKKAFDTQAFWKWACKQQELGWTVLISEYQCPIKSAVVLWEKNVSAGIRFGTKGDGGAVGSGKKKVEKLFTLSPNISKMIGLGLG